MCVKNDVILSNLFFLKIFLHLLLIIVAFVLFIVKVYSVDFAGQVDSNFCVGAILEKKLPPLPFTFALSAFANHMKGSYRFGVGLIVG